MNIENNQSLVSKNTSTENRDIPHTIPALQTWTASWDTTCLAIILV